MALAFILLSTQLPHAILIRVQKTEIAPVISERGHLIQINCLHSEFRRQTGDSKSSQRLSTVKDYTVPIIGET